MGIAAQQLKAAAHTSTKAWVQNVGSGDAEARGHSFPAPQRCQPAWQGGISCSPADLTHNLLLQHALPGAQPAVGRMHPQHSPFDALAPGLCTISSLSRERAILRLFVPPDFFYHMSLMGVINV